MAGQGQHVRLRVDADDRPDPGGERETQLAGAAAQIDSCVVGTEVERLDEGVEHLGWVTASVPGVVRRHLTAEACLHADSLRRHRSGSERFC